MNDKKFQKYVIETIKLLKKQALQAKKEADYPQEGYKDYVNGVIMGYYSIITLLKRQAFVFCVDQKELGLADIRPDRDLLGPPRNPDIEQLDSDNNPDIDFGEDNWSIDVMTEEKIMDYLDELTTELIEQARQAKEEADHPQEGESAEFNAGGLMAYHQAITVMKNQAHIFGLTQKDIGLADIEPGRDLV